MSEFEDKLNRILSNPEELEQISRLAAQLMGGSGSGEASPPPEGGSTPDLNGLLGSLGRAGRSDKSALLAALSPYLSPARRQKLQKAMRLAQAARIAGLALDAAGGDGSV